jgi:hypothetical protein
MTSGLNCMDYELYKEDPSIPPVTFKIVLRNNNGHRMQISKFVLEGGYESDTKTTILISDLNCFSFNNVLLRNVDIQNGEKFYCELTDFTKNGQPANIEETHRIEFSVWAYNMDTMLEHAFVGTASRYFK